MKTKYTLDEIERIVKELLIPRLGKFKIFTFTGPLGAGKTTLIKDFLKICGIKDIITSPTFNYVNSYTNEKGQKFNHFDLYRITNVDSFIDLGFDEYLYKSIDVKEKIWNLIEWPEVIKSLLEQAPLKQTVCNIHINYDDDNFNNRIIEFK